MAIRSKMQLARFLISGFEYCMEKTHAHSLSDVHLIWQNLHDSPNCQIKATAKYTTYMVAMYVAIGLACLHS